MTSTIGECDVGRRCRCLLIVVAALAVGWTSASPAAKQPEAASAAHQTLYDVDRPAVDDPSAVIVESPSSSSASSDDGRKLAKSPPPRHQHQHRHRTASGLRPSSVDRQRMPSSLADDGDRSTGRSKGSAPLDSGRPTAVRQSEGDESHGGLAEAEDEKYDSYKDDLYGDGREKGAGGSDEEVHPVAPVAELENVVSGLRAQLKESHATHMHTRSVINVLQEKQEAQERDLAIMKDDLARLRRELATERELVRALKAQAADSAWAIADVKRGQDQVMNDLTVMKRTQEQQNETLYLVEELMMSNAVELISHNKHAVAVRHDIAQLQAEAATDRGHLRALSDLVQQRLTVTDSSGNRWDEDGNSIDEADELALQRYGNHLSRSDQYVAAATATVSGYENLEPPEAEPNSTARQASKSSTPRRLHSSDESSSAMSPTSIKAKMDQYDADFARLNSLVVEVDNRISHLSSSSSSRPEHSPGGDRVAVGAELLQQAFVNFTRHIYGLEEAWRQQALSHNGVELQSAALNDERPASATVDRRLSALNASVVEARLAADADRSRSETALLGVDRRLAELAAAMAERDERQRYLELTIVNRSLEQCRRTNAELVADLRAAELVEKVASIERQIGDQSQSVNRMDNSMTAINQELRRHSDSITSLSKQAKLLRHLPSDVAFLHADLGNFAVQLPTDCTTAMGPAGSRRPDGVYLIRPPGGGSARAGRTTVRVYCQRDPVDPSTVWTVIQRRTDGRESFARGWEDYRAGFGDPSGEHWLGNDNMARMTSASVADDSIQRGSGNSAAAASSNSPRPSYRLRIDMWDVRGRYWLAEYPSFRIGGLDDLYRLELGDVDAESASTRENSVDAGSGTAVGVGVGDGPVAVGAASTTTTATTGGFSGNATDALRYSDRQPFSAIDRDNDVSTTDCARFYAAGWWYKHCHYANLNGRYTSGVVWFNEDIDEWLQMRHTVMKIAPATTSVGSSSSSSSSSSTTMSSSPIYHELSLQGGNGGGGGGSWSPSTSSSSNHRNRSKSQRSKDLSSLPSTAAGAG